MAINYLTNILEVEERSTMAIDVDSMFGEGLFGVAEEQIRVVDLNFFNRFEDDFDGSDIN